MKMPVSTIRYFAQQAYRHFAMTGRCNPIESKTVHTYDNGERVKIVCTVVPGEGVVLCSWNPHGGNHPGDLEHKAMPVRKSWAY